MLEKGLESSGDPFYPGMEKEIVCFAREQLSLTPVWSLSVRVTGFKIRFGPISGTSLQTWDRGSGSGEESMMEMARTGGQRPCHIHSETGLSSSCTPFVQEQIGFISGQLPKKGKKAADTACREVRMTMLFLEKPCSAPGAGTQVPGDMGTQHNILSQPVLLPAWCQPACTTYQKTCFVNRWSLCWTAASGRAGPLSHAPLLLQGPAPSPACDEQSLLSAPKLFPSDSSEALERMHLAIPGSPFLLPLPHHTSPKVLQATSTFLWAVFLLWKAVIVSSDEFC